MNRLYLALAFCIGFAAHAVAQITVLGSGLSADCYHAAKAGRTVGAVELCSRALNEETMTRATRAATFVNRGVLLMREGEYDRAEEDYTLAERLDPRESAIFVNRAANMIYQRDFQNALEQLDHAIRLVGTNLDRFPPASEVWLEQATRVGDDHLHIAYYNRGIAKQYSNDVQGAYYDFLSAAKLKPEWELVAERLENFVAKSTYEEEMNPEGGQDDMFGNQDGFSENRDQ